MPYIGHWYVLLITLVFWAVVITVIVLVIRSLLGVTQSKGSDSALGILNERFARGEIDQQEYEQRKAALLRH